jgi:hypothetical protein
MAVLREVDIKEVPKVDMDVVTMRIWRRGR